MKKILLSLAVACFGLAANSYAQTTYPLPIQDFESASGGLLPSGWTEHSTGIGGPGTPNTGWYTTTSAGTTWGDLFGIGSSGNIPAHTTYVVVDDDAHPTQLHDTLMSPTFSIAGANDPWVTYDFYYYGAQNNSSGIAESAYIIASSNGGSSWAIIDSVPADGGNTSWYTWHASLASLPAGSTSCKIGFVYSDHGGSLVGCALDNIGVINYNSTYAELTAIAYNSIQTGISNNGQSLAFEVDNDSSVAITSFVAYYTINGGGTVTQTFNPTPAITTYSGQQFVFTTPFTGAVAGTNNVHVGIISVNGVPEVDADSVQNSSFTLASASVTRYGLIEEFSSSTCNPCRYFNEYYDPLVESLGVNATSGTPASNTHEVKYQMNWPDWDNDRSYNADGADRQTYYNCQSIPDHWVNGSESQLGWGAPFSSTVTTNFTNEINNASALSAFMDMTMSYNVNPHTSKLGVTVTATPHFTKTGTYHMYVAIIDKHYQNICNEWGQLDYYNVERMMLPNGNGTAKTSWTDGTTFTYSDTGVAYTHGDWTMATSTPADTTQYYPAMHSTKFWSDPSSAENSEAVAWIQDDASHEILQSVVAPANNVRVSVSTMSKVDNVSMYPNPASDNTTLKFNMQVAGKINIRVIDFNGRVISEVMNTDIAAGLQTVNISTTNMASGNYLVLMETESGNTMQQLTVNRK